MFGRDSTDVTVISQVHADPGEMIGTHGGRHHVADAFARDDPLPGFLARGPDTLLCDDAQVSNNRQPRRPDVTTVEFVGAASGARMELQPYDDRWADIYRDHRERIRDALAAVDVEIEHIGSTSVPGLAAKPIVDIVVTVEDITAEEDYLDALVAAGYELRVREPGHRLVRTPAHDVHVHLFERGDPAVDDYFLLRDRLRSDEDDRALYESTKRALLSRRWADMNEYAEAKTDVILAIKARAREARGL